MSLIAIIVGLALVGLVLWLVTTYIPMPEPYKRVIIIVAIVIVVLWLIQMLGVLPGISIPRTP